MISKNLAIMFTDMKGFTSRTSKNSRKQVEKLLDLQDRVIMPVIERFGGNLIKTIGDSYMVTFESPTSAVLCGIKIQEAVAAASNKFELRCVINTGDVNIKKGDVFGEPVNVASRLESIAKPNEVFITEAVYLAMNKNDISTTMIGPKYFKGIPYPIRVYRVLTKRDLFEESKNLFLGNYMKIFVPTFSLLVLGLFVFWKFGVNQDSTSKINQQVEAVEIQSATPTSTPSPSPTPIPTPKPTPKPTSTPGPETPTPTPRSKHPKGWFR